MRTYIFKVNNLHTLEEYRLDKNNEREYITNDRQSITANIANFINRNSEIHIHPLDISIVNKRHDQVFTIVNYRELFEDRRYINIRDIVNRAMKKNPVIIEQQHANIGNTKRKKKKSFKTFIQSAVAGISASLIVAGVSHGITSLIKNDKVYEISTEDYKPSIKVEQFVSDTKYQSERPTMLSANVSYIQNDYINNEISKDPKVVEVITDPEEYTEHGEEFIKFVRPSLEEEISVLIEYFNVRTAQEVLDFMRVFINTMSEYDVTLTEEEMIDTFYDISQVPQDVKVQEFKDTYGLDDTQTDEVMATYVGEAGPSSYIGCFASSTTGLNHTQYQIWIDALNNSRKMEVGSNIYLHTCYIPQFEAYKGKLYTQYLGDRTVEGFNGGLDVFYLFEHYKVVMHNYSEFRSNGTTSFSNIQFNKNGNRYGHKMKAEDRIVSLKPEDEKVLKYS